MLLCYPFECFETLKITCKKDLMLSDVARPTPEKGYVTYPQAETRTSSRPEYCSESIESSNPSQFAKVTEVVARRADVVVESAGTWP